MFVIYLSKIITKFRVQLSSVYIFKKETVRSNTQQIACGKDIVQTVPSRLHSNVNLCGKPDHTIRP